nr:hypothetical protein [Granulosicoccus sp.]
AQNLLTATVRRFAGYCQLHDIKLIKNNFEMEYQSNIPFQVGLAGSSAIIIAGLRAMMKYYSVSIGAQELANLALAVETDELGIKGGLQDRVAQVYQGLVAMDFNREFMQRDGYGHYRWLDEKKLSGLYIAYSNRLAESSNVFHSDIRQRFEDGNPEFSQAIEGWKQLVDQGIQCIERQDNETLASLINQNFDYRAALYDVGPDNLLMIRIARQAGASAKFAGSGGAIIGTCVDENMYQRLAEKLGAIDVVVFRPEVAGRYPDLLT